MRENSTVEEPTKEKSEFQDLEKKFFEDNKEILDATQEIFTILKEIGIDYALIRHFAILLLLADMNLLSVVEELKDTLSINDVDILVGLDEDKIAELEDALKKNQKISNINIVREADQNPPGVYSFDSKTFITFDYEVEDKKIHFELFDHFGITKDDGTKETFASLSDDGGNFKPEVADVEINGQNFPCSYGKYVELSYRWQNAVNVNGFLSTKEKNKHISLEEKPIVRQTLLDIINKLRPNRFNYSQK